MRRKSIRAQAAVLSAANLLVRGAGFVMRILLSRLMGAETLGIMELASSAHMLVITPVTAGLPLAVSRLTAKSPPAHQKAPLAAGRWLVNRAALILTPLFLLVSPLIAGFLGDVRTWPSLLCAAPCLFILGHSAVLNGYCYGLNRALPPALSEIFEQLIRFILTLLLVIRFRHIATALLAALPALATLIAEFLGLALVMIFLKLPFRCERPERLLIKKTARLSAPPTLSRFLSVGLRSANAIIIPLRLQVSGLSAAEATARFGLFAGMAMPLIMLPSVFTGALAMLSGPALAARETNAPALRRLALRILFAAFLLGSLCAMALYALAPLIAGTLYRQAELAPLIRLLSPAVLMSGLQQVLSGMIAGLGRQKTALHGTVAGAAVTLVLSWMLTAAPSMRQNGTAIAAMTGQALTLCCHLHLMGRLIQLPTHCDDRSCRSQA